MATLRSLIILGATICWAVPASAQQASQQVVQAVNATNTTFVQDWNKHDPAALTASFTPNALYVAPAGSFVGREGVQQYYEKLFATMHPALDFTHDIDRVEMLSNDLAVAIGHWNISNPPLKGTWSAVYEHQGTAWPYACSYRRYHATSSSDSEHTQTIDRLRLVTVAVTGLPLAWAAARTGSTV
jgi:uncharacterized protein (TIGR02246 family)